MHQVARIRRGRSKTSRPELSAGNIRAAVRWGLMKVCPYAVLGFVLCVPVAAQVAVPSVKPFPETLVLLEPHNGQTRFSIGDRVVVDLVFSSAEPGYTVNTDDNPYHAVRDEIDISPAGGWERSHVALFGQGINGNAEVKLEREPVRVPILINRAITFEKPGHYELTLTTERVGFADWSANPPAQDCGHCRKTDALGIDIEMPGGSDESALVATLSRQLEQTVPQSPPEIFSPEQKEEIVRRLDGLASNPHASEEDKKKIENLVVSAEIRGEAQIEQREKARRETAERLAYLSGDDAMRAKVRFISDDPDNGEPDPVGAIMVDGLPSSRNRQLQLTLLEQAWRDPQHVPTFRLESALRQARELVDRGWVTVEQLRYAGTPEERKVAVDEYQNNLKQIVSTLPLRTPENRERTTEFLNKAGAFKSRD